MESARDVNPSVESAFTVVLCPSLEEAIPTEMLVRKGNTDVRNSEKIRKSRWLVIIALFVGKNMKTSFKGSPLKIVKR